MGTSSSSSARRLQPGAGDHSEPDSVFALTRDYVTARETASGAGVDDRGASTRHNAASEDRADMTRRLRAARTWLAAQLAFIPTKVEPANEIARALSRPDRDLRLGGR